MTFDGCRREGRDQYSVLPCPDVAGRIGAEAITRWLKQQGGPRIEVGRSVRPVSERLPAKRDRSA